MHHRLYDPQYHRHTSGREMAYHNVRAFAGTIKTLMGIKGALPSEGTQPVYVQGVRMWVRPLHGSGFQGLRVMCECPMCGAVLAAGRLNQHRC